MSDTMGNDPEIRPAATQGAAGAMLKAGREARRLSVDSVARELHWPPETVAALERDDYARLPPAAFLRGYIRSYARLLGLPEQELIAAYNRDAGAESAPALYSSMRSPSEGRPVSWRGPAGLIVLGILGIWAYQQWASRDAPIPAETPAELSGRILPESAPIETPVAVDAAGSPSAASPSPVPSSAASVSAPSPASAGVGQVPAPRSVQNEGEPVQEAGDTLVLSFSGDSWAGVIDAEGKKLLFRTMAKGQVVTVKGKAPFKITLGRPADTRIDYNGQAYDHGYTNNRSSVRFVLPKETAR